MSGAVAAHDLVDAAARDASNARLRFDDAFLRQSDAQRRQIAVRRAAARRQVIRARLLPSMLAQVERARNRY